MGSSFLAISLSNSPCGIGCVRYNRLYVSLDMPLGRSLSSLAFSFLEEGPGSPAPLSRLMPSISLTSAMIGYSLHTSRSCMQTRRRFLFSNTQACNAQVSLLLGENVSWTTLPALLALVCKFLLRIVSSPAVCTINCHFPYPPSLCPRPHDFELQRSTDCDQPLWFQHIAQSQT